ncbi:helicase-exonuclease AddAB subunit AddA [Aerococcaceae bacterium WGS1372]
MKKTFSIEPKPANSSFNDEQWQAIQQKGNNILISASAGSGKTTVLIERIYNHIIQEFAEINELLVVTFTEAAANEMKERMERRLKNAVNNTIDTNERTRFVQQLSLLPNANIQTLHSFCLEVIQNFFYLIDFNPNFSLITDDTQTHLMHQEVWNEMIQSINDNKVDEVSVPISIEQYDYLLSKYTNSRSDESLFDIVIELYLFARSQPEPLQWLNKTHLISSNFSKFIETSLFQQTIRPYIKNKTLHANQLLLEVKNIMQTCSNETIGKYESLINNEMAQTNSIYQAMKDNNINELFQSIDKIYFDKWKSNSKKSDDYEIVNEMKDLRDEAKKTIEAIRSLFTYDYELSKEIEEKVAYDIQLLSQLTRIFMDYLSKYKAHYSLVDYNDLEHLTLQILAPIDTETNSRKPSPAALYYQSHFKEIMIDEFQDINDIQNSILYYLSHETREDLDKNLFMVGDVKQSIYGFRMAEPSLFLERYRNYQKTDNGELIILDKNYRSRDEILQFTNFIFERIMDKEFGEMDYGIEESLTTGNYSFIPIAPNEQFNIEFKLFEKEDDNDNLDMPDLVDELNELTIIDSSIEAQAHIIAQDIMEKVNNKYEIYDKEFKKTRPVSFSDFVILTSTRNPFLTTQRIFELYGIPLYAQKIENYFQRQEVQLMVALLKLIDNPLQDIPLVAILRSYFVQLTDSELSLIRIHQPQGLFYEAMLSYLQSDDTDKNLQNKLTYFMQQLNKWQLIAESSSLVNLIWTIYQDTSFLDYVAGLSNGVQREANLHALYQKARDFEQSQFMGVFGFIQFIEQMMQQQNDLAEPVLIESDQNAVRLMTVHASKGLEFPIVYIMDTAKKFNLQDARTKPYIPSKKFGLSSDYYDNQLWIRFKSFSKQAFKIEKENSLKAEEMRKLYVALTRCEQKLIIVGAVKNQDSWEEQSESITNAQSTGELLVPQNSRQSASSWLDWMQQAIAVGESENSNTDFLPTQVDIEFVNKQQLMDHPQLSNLENQYTIQKDIKKIVNQLSIETIGSRDIYDQLTETFYNEYPFQLSTRTSSYQSVSELKRLYEEPRIEKIDYYVDRRENTSHNLNQTEEDTSSIQGIRYTADTFQPPAFLNDDDLTVTYAEIGSATHFVLQHLDFSSFAELNSEESKQIVEDKINNYREDGYLSDSLVDKINTESIIQFIESDIGKVTIENAHKIRREQAFSYLIEAKNIFGENLTDLDINELNDNQLLIHGVIDNFIEFDDSIVIFDYKTDRYKPYTNLSRKDQIEQLISKYRFQISLYSKALEVAFSKPVVKAYIILLDFGESIEITDFYNF